MGGARLFGILCDRSFAADVLAEEVMIQELNAPHQIEEFCRRDPLLHLYEIGDLDPFFWPHTRWWATTDPNGEREAIALLYDGCAMPTLLLLERERPECARALLAGIRDELPARCYAHLSPGLEVELKNTRLAAASLKMGLCRSELLAAEQTAGVEALTAADRDALVELYEVSYPGNWFDERMLATGQYYGIRDQARLLAVAGVHVYSPTYRVAALGNITTHPAHRGRGLGRRVTARLCQALLATVDVIGLNVHAANAPAIACYERLGFERVAEYGEYWIG